MSEKIMSGTEIVDTVDALEKKIDQVRKAQQIFSTYTQEQVDKIFTAAAIAANQPESHLPKWQLRKQEWELLRTK